MHSYYTSLDDQELLEISGEDSEKFLQGQLTCDLSDIDNDQLTLGALCNNKGRVYASFRLLRHADTFYMSLPMGLLDPTRSNLKKYIPFYKAAMADASTRFKRFGLVGTDAQDYLSRTLLEMPESGHARASGEDLVLNLGGSTPRYEIWSATGDSSLVTGLTDLDKRTMADWKALDMQAGVFLVETADIDQYTPEEANMDLAGFISFNKGCYTGQEIVARMHYRGKAAKRLFLVTFKAATQIRDSDLKNNSGKTLGKTSNILDLNNISIGFIVLKTDTDLSQPLFLTTEQGPVAVTVTPLSRF
jgi:folate-binding protein YgfZ